MTMSQGSGKTSQPSYKTADAAAFIQRISMGAYGRCIIGFIDDADTMSEPVQNKLLKTLEEPSPGTHIILAAANRANLLETVRSRCMTIRLSEYDQETYMHRHSIQPEPETGLKDNRSLTELLLGGSNRFHEFRAAADKHIKTREDAAALLDSAEDSLRSLVISTYAPDSSIERNAPAEPALSMQQTDPYAITDRIELINIARMDIARGMTGSKALKRLWLELR